MTVPPRSAPSGLVHAVVATSAATSVVENVNDLAFGRSMGILGCWAGNSRRGRMHTRGGPVPRQRFGRRIGAMLSLILLAVAAASCSAPEKAPVARVAPVDFVLVEKGARTLQLVRGGTAVRTYRIALGRDPVGAKRREGDGRTPEGRYYVDGDRKSKRLNSSH